MHPLWAQPATLSTTWRKWFSLYPAGTSLILKLCLLLLVHTPCTTGKVLVYLHQDLLDDMLIGASGLPLGPLEATSSLGSINLVPHSLLMRQSAPAAPTV